MTRKIQKTATVLAALFVLSGGAKAQDTLRSPLTIPLQFSGNFGEIRTGHFHTGLDIRTDGKEGIPVLAAQDGRISRIKVSHRGYGLALYLNGGGWTTVYAHLSAFHPDIEAWLMRRQYRDEKWAFDGAPDSTFKFQAGDTIGWSGNTGGSFGPHLHFEVRDARNQHPVNPLHWSFSGQGMAADPVPPEFRGVWVVPEQGGQVEGAPERFRWTAAYAEGVRASGPFTLGVEGFDRLAEDAYIHGPYGVDVWFADSLVHSHRMDTLDFSTNGDVSAHIDLPAWQDRKARVHRVQRLPGNRLDIYRNAASETPFEVAPGDSVEVRVQLLDMAGNATDAAMWIWGDSIPDSDGVAIHPARLDRSKPHRISVGEVIVDLPANALYGDAVIEVETLDSVLFRVESEARVTRSDYALTVPVPESVAGSGEALVLCALDEEGEVSGTWVADERNGQLSVRLDRFGVFEVRRDSVAPRLGSARMKGGVVAIAVHDELSGIARWDGQCGNQWLRWSMDKGILRYRLEDGMLEGREEQEVKVWAIDNAGNIGHTRFRLRDLQP